MHALTRFVLLAALGVVVGAAHAQRFEAGTHYQVLSPAQPTSTEEAGAVEVAEVFAYTCIHCYRFEPQIERWLERKPDYVNFVRIPAVFDDLRALHARAFYTAEALGKLEEMHPAFFAEIHDRSNMLASEPALQELFSRFGVDPAQFESTFGSADIQAKVERAANLMRRYRVPETPSMVVNGKYLSLGGMAGGSYSTWFAVIDELAASERDAE